MKTNTLGKECPEFAVVACLHGDEVCGKEAIESFLVDPPEIRKSVKFIIANERALQAGTRYIDEDLNRAFPGDPNGDSYEQRVAAKLLDEIKDCKVLDLHSTVSHSEPFALLQKITPVTARLAMATGVDNVVDISYVSGGMIAHIDGVAVECGLRGTSTAKENAKRTLTQFLAANGITDHQYHGGDPDLYQICGEVPAPDYEFVGENFEQIEEGEIYARKNGDTLVADQAFYPVLMSTDGYEDRLGYKATKLGPLSQHI